MPFEQISQIIENAEDMLPVEGIITPEEVRPYRISDVVQGKHLIWSDTVLRVSPAGDPLHDPMDYLRVSKKGREQVMIGTDRARKSIILRWAKGDNTFRFDYEGDEARLSEVEVISTSIKSDVIHMHLPDFITEDFIVGRGQNPKGLGQVGLTLQGNNATLLHEDKELAVVPLVMSPDELRAIIRRKFSLFLPKDN